jgi:dephospho-CoA kinase
LKLALVRIEFLSAFAAEALPKGAAKLIVAGLTGGIASGKSTVAKFFRQFGARIIDADEIARRVVQKGLPAWQGIVDQFGRQMLQADGQLDRRRLADAIFADSRQQQRLNAIVHPHVIRKTEAQLRKIAATHSDAVVILDVPLLFEAQMDKDLEEIIVVYVPESTQLKRLMQRDHLCEADAWARIRAQMPIEEKRRRATIIIDNSGPTVQTREAARTAYQTLKRKSQ